MFNIKKKDNDNGSFFLNVGWRLNVAPTMSKEPTLRGGNHQDSKVTLEAGSAQLNSSFCIPRKVNTCLAAAI